jgi:hypothetical protein
VLQGVKGWLVLLDCKEPQDPLDQSVPLELGLLDCKEPQVLLVLLDYKESQAQLVPQAPQASLVLPDCKEPQVPPGILVPPALLVPLVPLD